MCIHEMNGRIVVTVNQCLIFYFWINLESQYLCHFHCSMSYKRSLKLEQHLSTEKGQPQPTKLHTSATWYIKIIMTWNLQDGPRKSFFLWATSPSRYVASEAARGCFSGIPGQAYFFYVFKEQIPQVVDSRVTLSLDYLRKILFILSTFRQRREKNWERNDTGATLFHLPIIELPRAAAIHVICDLLPKELRPLRLQDWGYLSSSKVFLLCYLLFSIDQVLIEAQLT